MTSTQPWRNAVLFILLAAIFALSYSQSPLYTSNQYQYFVHGLARCGEGTLAEDWLASTADPTPVFSFLVEVTCRLDALPLVYVYYGLLMGIYFFALAGIVETVVPIRSTPLLFVLFFALTILLHSAALRYLLISLAGPNWGYLFDGGVAGQRLLGPVFQPSSFGVFLLLSLYFRLRGKTLPAVLSAVFAATVHPTYLLSAAALTLAYLVELAFVQRRPKRALLIGATALAAVTPILLYAWTVFGGSDPALTARARDILVNIRIPHHARIAEWFDATTIVKLCLLAAGIFAVRRQRLFLLLSLPLGISVLLSLVQAATDSRALALLFPWRLSAWLVPVAVAILTAELARRLAAATLPCRAWLLEAAALLVIGLAVLTGLTRTWLETGEQALAPSRPVAEYVSAHRQPGQVYLIPPKMYDFRLTAAAPVYGDFFSIPYRDADVVEWYSRFLNAQHFYETANCALLEELSWQGVTHVVLPADFAMLCPALRPLYSDPAYQLFELNSE